MRVFNTIFVMLCGYILVLALNFFNPNLFQLMFVAPVHHYQFASKVAELENDEFDRFFYYPKRYDESGVTIKNTDGLSYGDYTFFTDINFGAKLININGDIVHSWNGSPKEIWADSEYDVENLKENLFTNSRAFLDPKDGSVYFLVKVRARETGELGLVKLDKDSNVVWRYDGLVHHDMSFSEDRSRIYALNKTIHQKPHSVFAHFKPPFWDEGVVILDANGKEIKSLSFFDLFAKSPYKYVLENTNTVPLDTTFPHGDIFHSNTVEIISSKAAGKAPMLVEGHLLISFRNLNLLAIIDPDKEEITWASYGPWHGQHDPKVHDDGTVVMFDNKGSFEPGTGSSRVLQADLNSSGIVWAYSGTKEKPMESPYNSSVDILPNGNILATESHGARIFEVTRDKELVWEYWNPNSIIIKDSKFGEEFDNTEHVGSLFSATRHKKEDLPFLENKE